MLPSRSSPEAEERWIPFRGAVEIGQNHPDLLVRPAIAAWLNTSAGHTQRAAGPNEQIVRQAVELINTSESVDEVVKALGPVMDPGIEWVNPADAIERGTRKGEAGMRKVLENFMGAGVRLTMELLEVEENGDRVLVGGRMHARGASSGAEALGLPVGIIYTFRGGRIARVEWHNDVDEARARFERNGK